jgi:hypothetical protein
MDNASSFSFRVKRERVSANSDLVRLEIRDGGNDLTANDL